MNILTNADLKRLKEKCSKPNFSGDPMLTITCRHETFQALLVRLESAENLIKEILDVLSLWGANSFERDCKEQLRPFFEAWHRATGYFK